MGRKLRDCGQQTINARAIGAAAGIGVGECIAVRISQLQNIDCY
jgi:hypothetical protein